MTEEQTERSEQTTPAHEQKFGREGNEVGAGYKPLDTGPKIDMDREALANAIGVQPGEIPPSDSFAEGPKVV